MNEPRDKNNFLIEITPAVMGELNKLYMHSDTEPVVELHYSPYWKKFKPGEPSHEANN
jgi:hypothetical protein